VLGDSIRFSAPQHWCPPWFQPKNNSRCLRKKSKKNTPTDVDQEDHYTKEDNEISLTAEPSQIIDQERKAKLEALQKARVEKVARTLEPFTKEKANEEDDHAIDRELERVQQKVQQLPKEKDRFAN
jgi:hypothetical protein